MYNYVTTFNDMIEEVFGNYTRPFKEVDKYRLYRKDNKGYLLVVNAIGLDNDSIEVTLDQPESGVRLFPRINISGKKKNEINDFEYSVNISSNLMIKEKIDNIAYDCKNGVLNIIIKTKQSDPQNKLTASKVDLDTFEW